MPPPPSPDARRHFSHLPLAPDGFTVASRITADARGSLLSSRGLHFRGLKADFLQRGCENGVALSPRPEMAGPAPLGTPSVPPACAALAPSAQANAALDGGAGASEPRPAPVSPAPLADASRGDGAAAGALPPVDPVGGAAPPGGRSGVTASAGKPSSAARCGSRAPCFTRHERARLAHILGFTEVGAGVVASRWGMARQQQDARQSRAAVWVLTLLFICVYGMPLCIGCSMILAESLSWLRPMPRADN